MTNGARRARRRRRWTEISNHGTVAQNYDLSASRYHQIEQDEVFYEKPAVTLERLRVLEHAAEAQVVALEKMVKGDGHSWPTRSGRNA